MTRSTPHFTTACLLLAGAVFPLPFTGDGGEEIIASYRNRVTREELVSWQSFLGREEANTDNDLDLHELVLVTSLAAEAERLGLHGQLDTRLELELREAAMAEAALRRHLSESIKISDKEVEAWYQANKDTFTLPQRIRLRNIFKRYPPGAADDDARTEVRTAMDAIRQRALGGEDFGKLAAEVSDSQTRFQNGLLGNISPGTLAPAIDEVAMDLKPGETSEVLESPDGLTILFCEAIIPAVERSPEELRTIARQRLKARAFKKQWASLRARWLESANIRYYWDELSPDPQTEGAVVVETVGENLTTEHLASLLSARGDMTHIPRPQIEQRIESFVATRAAAAEARSLGLLEDEAWAERLLWTRRQVLASRALLHLVEARLEVPGEAEVRRYFDSHRQDFKRPEYLHLAVILLPSLEGENNRQVFAQGALVVQALEEGETSFEEAARRFSRHASAPNGGKLGWVSRPALPRIYGMMVLKAVLRLQDGETSDLVQDGENLWILQRLDTEDERPMTWEEARSQAEDRLGQERTAEVERLVRQEWMDNLQLQSAGAQSP